MDPGRAGLTPRAGRRATRLGVALVLLAAGLACARSGERGIPLPGQLASVDSDRERGFAFDREAQKQLPLVHDLAVLEFVDDLGHLLVQSLGDQPFDYRFRVIVHPDLNAFAVPGGYVYLHSGTILNAGSVEELAGVLAHELGHVKGRHSARMAKDTAIPSLLANVAGIAAAAASGQAGPMIAAQAANVAIQLQYARQYEDEADRMAVVFLNRSGYGPEGLVRFFERIELEQTRLPEGTIPPYLFSHPQVESRIDVVRGLQASTSAGPAPPERLGERMAETQAKLGWLVERRRTAWAPVAPYDRTHTDPALADAGELAASGRFDEALATLEQAEQQEPGDPRVPLRRAEILERQGRTADAIAAYRRAVHLDPNQAAVLLALGRAHKAAGQRREALFFFDQASFRAGPTGRARASIDGEIERTLFPVIDASGFATGAQAEEAETALAGGARTLPRGEQRLAWWGRLSDHWRGHSSYMKVRWVDPAGNASEPERPDRESQTLVARREIPDDAPPGPWKLELLLGEEVVHTETIEGG
jgi:predicted Zn-dependent protease